MGYFVSTREISFTVPKGKLDEAYKAVCDLNQHNHLKRGGVSPREEKDGPHENIWFSWMPWDYPEVFKDLEEVLNALGFETEYTDGDDLSLCYYDSKAGQEQLFLETIAPFVEEGSFIEWVGEDNAMWRDIVKDGKIVRQTPNITWE